MSPVMSGDFTQRGEPALLDKWTRAKIAAENGSTQTEKLKICHHVNVATEVILVISDIIMLFKGNFVEFLVSLCLAAGVIASMINAKAMSFLEGELYTKYGMN